MHAACIAARSLTVAARRPSRWVDARHRSPSLQPLAGILLSLWRAEQDVQEQSADQPAAQPAAGRPARRQSLAAALNRQAALTSDVLQGLLEAEVGCCSVSRLHWRSRGLCVCLLWRLPLQLRVPSMPPWPFPSACAAAPSGAAVG